MTPATASANPLPRGAAAALMLGCALSGFDAGAVGYVLPALRAATGADAQTASWLVSAYVIGMLAGIPLAGSAVARFGAAPLFRLGLGLALGGAALALATESIAVLLAARALQGLGQGPLLPLAATLVAQQWPVHRQGRLVGALSIAYGVAFLAATAVAPPLLQLGWRATFALSLGVAAVALLSTRARVATAPKGDHGAGAATPAEATATARSGLRSLGSGEMMAIGALSLGTGVGQAMLVWFPTLAIVRLGTPPAASAWLMLPLVGGGIAATLAITAWLDRLGARRMLGAGAAATLLGLLLALLWPPSRLAFMAGAGAFGLGIVGLCGGPLRYAAARALPAGGQGPAQSAVALLTNIGLLGGSVLIGALAGGGRDERAGVEAALLAAGALMAASFAALWMLRPHREAGAAATAAPAPGEAPRRSADSARQGAPEVAVGNQLADQRPVQRTVVLDGTRNRDGADE